MIEVEKRLGLVGDEVLKLKEKLEDTLGTPKTLRRTILIKTGDNFVPDPAALIDIKVKLIDDFSLLSIKHGVWHADSARREYETHFERSDLSQLISSLAALGHTNFILLCTKRLKWQSNGLAITLDEYTNADQRALFEVEVSDASKSEHDLDQLFNSYSIVPMSSDGTIRFMSELNQLKSVQIDLLSSDASAIANIMIEHHS